MLSATDTYIISPEQTPGHIHVASLTKESAYTAGELLEKNGKNNHIFFTTEEETGVRMG